MKILIPILGFGKSGGSRVLSKLADELITLGYEVIFFCPDKSNPPYFPTLAKIMWINIHGDSVENNYDQENTDSGWIIQQNFIEA